MLDKFINGMFELLKVYLPGVILPIFILWLSNKNTRKLKEIDLENEIDKARELKKLEITNSINKEKSDYEKIVHASLIKILFEIQKLHISLSGKCDNYKCIDNATENFIDTFTKYQSVIADNQIFLSSYITNKLYEFYKILSELLIELKYLKQSNNFDIAIVSVSEYSTKLADILILIQEHFIDKKEELKNEFNKIELTNFTKCCGNQPPDELRDKYYQLKNQINNSYVPIQIVKY